MKTAKIDTVAKPELIVVRMPGPWDGPVRVIAEDECSFRLATLAGHLASSLALYHRRTGQGPGRLVVGRVPATAQAGVYRRHSLRHQVVETGYVLGGCQRG